MPSKTIWKVRDESGCMVGQTAHAEDAAALVGLRESGVVVYDHWLTVWREGREAFPAGESYDAATYVMHARLDAYQRAALSANMGDGSGNPHKVGLAAAAALSSEGFQP